MIEPFRIEVPDHALGELRARLAATRWPEPATGPGQGVTLERLRALCDYWAEKYDWRATEARLNAYQHVRVDVDGLRVHALHARSPHAEATPLVLTHGWPGSFLEFEGALAGLTDPTAHGGTPADAFHVVLPSLPGYGFSDRPAEPGWDVHRTARAWVRLMGALGYERFGAGGSDWGTSVSTSIALQSPDRLVGLHLVPPLAPPWPRAERTPAEAAAAADLARAAVDGSAYSVVNATRPQTVGYALTDSPAGLAAWIVEKLDAWVDPSAPLPDDAVLDDVTLYWLTRTAASSARLYTESIGEITRWLTTGSDDLANVPTGATVFPYEVPRPSRREAERRFPRIVHWGEPEHGGHFGAWEQPETFVAEVRETFRAIGQAATR